MPAGCVETGWRRVAWWRIFKRLPQPEKEIPVFFPEDLIKVDVCVKDRLSKLGFSELRVD